MEISEEIRRKLIKERDRMLFKNKDVDCKLGKLAYNKKTQEYGFIIGPFSYLTDMERVSKKYNPSVNFERLLMVVIKRDGEFGVRYPNKNSLITFPDREGEDGDNNSSSDLEKFCNSQCIFECSSDCVLFKYRRKK